MSLSGKTVFISGASRGIGLAIALRVARDGANVAIASKTSEPHPKLSGTIHTAAKEIEAAGGNALPLLCDIRSEEQVVEAIGQTVKKFGGIDICINNASAISLTDTAQTTMKRFDLMNQVNARGTFLCSKMALPHLKKAENPHILNISPPLDMRPKWFAPHVAYTMAKYGMSICTLGMAEEFRGLGIAVNSLWPLTAIHTAAVTNMMGEEAAAQISRSPQIMSDAAYEILTRTASEFTGNFCIDEVILREVGVDNFDQYASAVNGTLAGDLFIPDEVFEGLPTKVMR